MQWRYITAPHGTHHITSTRSRRLAGLGRRRGRGRREAGLHLLLPHALPDGLGLAPRRVPSAVSLSYNPPWNTWYNKRIRQRKGSAAGWRWPGRDTALSSSFHAAFKQHSTNAPSSGRRRTPGSGRAASAPAGPPAPRESTLLYRRAYNSSYNSPVK
jgi:hypothetical protein